MSFKNTLKSYMEQLDCSAKALAESSGLSVSVISRYCSGSRTPSANSQQLKNLAKGIEKLALQKNKTSAKLQYDAIMENFNSLFSPAIDTKTFASKINYFITELNINVALLSKALNYDASFLSRIRSGDRMPSDAALFIWKFAEYLVQNYEPKSLAQLLEHQYGRKDNISLQPDGLLKLIETFFLDSPAPVPNQTSDFLHKLDEFDLNEYIRSVHFNELKVPSSPFQLHTWKEYYGMEGQKKGELDFLKGTVLAKTSESVFMCSDMDMEDMSEDMDFSKKWVMGLAMLLKRGIHINVVHNLNRPWNELMLGLQAWIPLYMTGQVTPYYLRGIHNDFYQHLLYTSGSYALSGECIRNYHNHAKFILTNGKNDLEYYKERSSSIIKKAYSLMDIYTVNNLKVFHQFSHSADAESGNRHYITSSLPIFTLSEEFLSDILHKNLIPENDIKELLDKAAQKRDAINKILSENKLFSEIPFISREEFERHPLMLDMTEFDYLIPIAYSYDEYLAHIEENKKFAKAHVNYTFKLREDFAFRNIQIRILEGKWVWISKIKSPVIHFIIRHPHLRNAIENMYVLRHE